MLQQPLLKFKMNDTTVIAPIAVASSARLARGPCFVSLPMYKALVQQQCPFPIFRGQVPRSFIFPSFPAIFFSLTVDRSESYALSYQSRRDDLQIIHCSLIPRFDVLRQCCCHSRSVPPWPRCSTRRTLLTSICRPITPFDAGCRKAIPR